MPKVPSIAEVKAFLDRAKAYKEQFTGGFYHGSPSPNINAFDPSKSAKDPMYTTPQATFVTRDPEFAESFLSMNNSGKIKSGSTMYPVSVNLGKHWHPETPEGQQLISEFIEKYPKRVNLAKNLKKGDWTAVENADFIRHLQDTGHDTFHVMEGGVPNVGVFEPQNIRGKFADFNPDEAMNPDFMKAEGGLIHMAPGGKVPEAVVKAYKLFRTKPNEPGTLYPLFVNANKPVPLNEWVSAEVGPVAASGKVKSKLGELAYRPGWHAGDLPIATHIGGKSDPTLKAPDYRRPDEVWAEVEMPNDVDWQTIANQRAELNKAGKIIPRTAHITDQIPEGGHYRYKTSPNMQGNWLIGGDMKVNKILTDEEVQAINEAAGMADLPRFTPLPGKAAGGEIVKKALEFAKSIPFVHFSKAENISRLEPAMYGTGIKGAEGVRLQDAPDIKPRSYFYTDRPDVRPEQGLGSVKYSGVSQASYPLHEDPAGYYKIAKELAKDPYFAKQGVEIIDQPKMLNEVERAIKNAGYTGYHTDDAGILFHPTDVTKATD
jgi:hypothetical protein